MPDGLKPSRHLTIIKQQFKAMDKYSKMMSAYAKIWLTASIINAVISSLIIISLFNEQIIGLFFLILFFSYIFSIPILVVAIVCSAIALSLQKNNNIVGTVFIVTLLSSLAGVLFFKGVLGDVNGDPVPLGASIIISSLIAAAIVFRNKLKLGA
jgi:hypothetical protein